MIAIKPAAPMRRRLFVFPDPGFRASAIQ